MARIISIHSFRGGTGKSNTTANLAYMIARRDHRVGIIDTDIQSPGIHVLFRLSPDQIKFALNDYLRGDCPIEQAAYDVSAELCHNGQAPAPGGSIHLIPSSIKTGEIASILRDGYDVGRLNDGIQEMVTKLQLNYLLIDTHPGVNEETLLSIAISDVLILVLRPDHQDYQGTAVTVDLARQLDVARMLAVVNKVPRGMDTEQVAEQVRTTFGIDVAAVLPLSEEVARLASERLFCPLYPDHEITRLYEKLAVQVAA